MNQNAELGAVNVLDPNQIIKEAENKNINTQKKTLQRHDDEEGDLRSALLQRDSIESPSSFEQTAGTIEGDGNGNFFLKDKSINRFRIPMYPSAQNFDVSPSG